MPIFKAPHCQEPINVLPRLYERTFTYAQIIARLYALCHLDLCLRTTGNSQYCVLPPWIEHRGFGDLVRVCLTIGLLLRWLGALVGMSTYYCPGWDDYGNTSYYGRDTVLCALVGTGMDSHAPSLEWRQTLGHQF